MRYLILFVLSFSTMAFESKDILKKYANHVFYSYSQTLSLTKVMSQDIDNFLFNPSQVTLNQARHSWTQARKAYGETEIFRFYAGPIDDDRGLEGLINAWPLDENYIDFVKGAPNSGIINNSTEYPVLTKEVLLSLNEKDGEKNISTGWHAIEFLLWGQDFDANGAGNRDFNDFVIGSGQNAHRRRVYLDLIVDILEDHLNILVEEWSPSTQGNYFFNFTSSENNRQKIEWIMNSLVLLAGEELSIERVYVAVDTQFQEDEQSCFSDTTMNDLYHNFRGIKEVWSIISGLSGFDKIAIQEINNEILKIEDLILSITISFDQAIANESSKKTLSLIVNQLIDLSEKMKKTFDNIK